MSDNDLPALPYNGTEGYSGGDSSRERAEREAASGEATERQKQIIEILRERRSAGATYREVGDELGEGHGSVSGSLSTMQQEGHITRLKQRRHRCEIYILEEFVNGREIAPYKPNKKGVPLEEYETLKSRAEAAEAEVERLNTRALVIPTPASSEQAEELADYLEKYADWLRHG